MSLLPVSLATALAATAALAQPNDFPIHRLELDGETTWQSDIFLAESGIRYEQEWDVVRWDAAFTYDAYALEYEPFRLYDLFGFNQSVHEDRFAGQATVRPRIGERLTLIASGGYYDGFQDYRRVWLANYYRQRYRNPLFIPNPGYQEPDPKGWNGSAGLRWEYWRDLGFLEGRVAYNVDDIAPGYIDDPRSGLAIPGRDRLYTTSGILSLENIMGPRIRALNELRVSDTTERELRWSWQGSLNFALGERWIFRPLGGYTVEEPAFEAFWVGGALEFQVTPWLAVIAAASHYEDTGEVLDPSSFSTAAPGLRSQQFTLGFRVTWSRWILKVAGGPYNTDYDPLPANSRAFTNLYRDRNWALAQATLGVTF